MKRLFLALSALGFAAACATALRAPLPFSTPVTSYVTFQTMIDGGLPSSATDGVNLYGLAYIRATACAPDGGSFTGSGKLQGELYSLASTQWVHVPDWDKSVTNATHCQSWNELEVGTHSGQLKYVFEGVTATWDVDGGAVPAASPGTVVLEMVNY